MSKKTKKPKTKPHVATRKTTKGREKSKAKVVKSSSKVSSSKASGKASRVTTTKAKSTPKVKAVKPTKPTKLVRPAKSAKTAKISKAAKPAVKSTHKSVTKSTPVKTREKTVTKIVPKKGATKVVTKTKKEIVPPMPTKSSAPKVMKVTSARQAKLKKILSDKRTTIMKVMQEQLGQSLNDEQQRRLESAMDSGDQALLDLEREMGISLQEMRNKERQFIDNALTRLQEGSYGMCADCGDEISEKRLEALPFATLCVACQSKRELLEKIERGEQRM